MFQFPSFPSPGLWIQPGDTWAFPQVGFPIRAPPDQRLMAAPRGLSQPSTPFIGSWRQGIHRAPLVA